MQQSAVRHGKARQEEKRIRRRGGGRQDDVMER